MVPLEYAAPYSPALCLDEKRRNLELAAITRAGQHDHIHEEALERAEWWQAEADRGGNDAFRFQTCFPLHQ